jgi:polygalacturonase
MESEILTTDGPGESVLERVPVAMLTQRGAAAPFAAVIESVAGNDSLSVKNSEWKYAEGTIQIAVARGASSDCFEVSGNDAVSLEVDKRKSLAKVRYRNCFLHVLHTMLISQRIFERTITLKIQPQIIAVVAASVFASSLALAGEDIIDIRDQGAVGDGKMLCTVAIQKAIDQCAAGGGGTVYFPPGTWLSGTIELRSHITLKLDAGCCLVGSPNLDDYPKRVSKVPSYTSRYTERSLIFATDVENVTICGQGTIDGNASKFSFNGWTRRPFVIRMIGCRDIHVENVAMRNSAMWMQLYLACQRVRIRGISVHNHVNINNDGLDIDGCRDVAVSDCVIDSDDDSIVLKSTGDRPCENVAITNCVLSSHCAALKTGTESTGGFRNITISNCAVFAPSGTRLGKDPTEDIYRRGGGGISLGLYDGGTLENVIVSNVTVDGFRSPINVVLVDRGRTISPAMPKPAAGLIRNVIISNVVATNGAAGINIVGLPGRFIENLQLSNIQITLGMVKGEEANGLRCENVVGLRLRDISIHSNHPQLNNAVSNVKGLLIDGLDVKVPGGTPPVIRLRDCPEMILRNSGKLQAQEEGKQP